MNDERYQKMWEDEKNWGTGICGWYFCKDDPRLWVPKRIKAMGITINLGHPKGGRTLVMLFLAPVIVLVFSLLVTIAISISKCGHHVMHI